MAEDEEAGNLATLIQAGALPVELEPVGSSNNWTYL